MAIKNVDLDNLNPEDEFMSSLKVVSSIPDMAYLDAEADDDEAADDSESESDEDANSGEGEGDDLENLPPDDSDEADEEIAVPAKKSSSKEQEKIIALKRELRDYKEKLTKAEAKSKVEADAQQMETLVAKYTESGYDEDTAKQWAKTEFGMQEMKQQLAISNFKADNAGLFEIYPDAKADANKIIQTMNLTGFSAKQVCRALYAEETNPSKERAKKAVSGTLERTPTNNSISNATRTPRSGITGLSEAEKRSKSNFMKTIGLDTLDDGEYLKYKEQYGI